MKSFVAGVDSRSLLKLVGVNGENVLFESVNE
jgi:hypothetical protein